MKIPLTTLALVLPIALSGLVDLPRKVSLGPVSSLALLTICYCAAAWLLWSARPILTRQVLITVWPLMALVFLGILSFTWYAPTIAAVQNLITLITFLGLVLLASGKSYSDHKFQLLAWKVLVWATWIAVGLYGIGIVRGGLDNNVILSARSFALFAVFGIAWYLAVWRYKSRQGLWWAIGITAMIGASISRLALGAALLLFPLSQASLRNVRGWVRVSVLIVLVVGSSYLVFSHVEPLRDRFLVGDTQSVGGAAINVEGRDELWRITLESWSEPPQISQWIGKGVGSATGAIEATDPPLDHPHNEFLRILHDYGIIGLGLWLLAVASLLWAIWKAWARADYEGSEEAVPHLAVLLSLVAWILGMITDNVIAYIYLMAPLGVVVGASLGRMKPD